ncbi:MAG: hypothetical protein AB1705_22020 [Verrucomicrobiota bacterium]
MKGSSSFLATALALLCIALGASGRDLGELRALYIGDTNSPRAREFQGFLKANLATVETASRREFNPKAAAGFDVVLLDWPQGEEARLDRQLRAPLGDRDKWDKPTVLLGSAGLNLAVAWKAKGGIG